MPRQALQRLLGAGCLTLAMLLVAPSIGGAQVPGQDCDVDLLERDDQCEEWVAGYDHPESHDLLLHQREYLHGAAIDPRNDRIFVTGESYDSTSETADIATLAYSTEDGSRLWLKRYSVEHGEGIARSHEVGSSLTLSSSGKIVFVTGEVQQSSTGEGDWKQNDITLAYDASDGTQLWRSSWSSGESDELFDSFFAKSSNDMLYVAGVVQDRETMDIKASLIVAYSATSGRQEWAALQEGEIHPEAMTLSRDGSRVFLGGYRKGATEDSRDWFVSAYHARSGKKMWSAIRSSGIKRSALTDLAVSSDGRIVHGIGIHESSSEARLETISLDSATGETLWAKPLADKDHEALVIDPTIESAGRRVYAAGNFKTSDSLRRLFLFSFDSPTGRPLWKSEAVKGESSSLTVTDDGRQLISAGQGRTEWPVTTQTNGRIDCVTLSLDAGTGAIEWIARFESPMALRGHNCMTPDFNTEDIGVLVDEDKVYIASTKAHSNIDGNTPPTDSNTFDYLLLAYPRKLRSP